MKRLLSILCAICLTWPLYAQELSNFANREQVVSPEIKEGKITFRLVAPEAKTVQLTGGFMPTKKVTYNNREMDVRNFHKKMRSLDYITLTDDMQDGVSHRAARYYRFDKVKYNKHRSKLNK